MNAKTSSTIGFERKHNSAAVPRSRAEFIHEMNANLPQRPPNMATIVERNRANYLHAEAPLDPRPLDLHTFQHEMAHGALIIDTRSPHQFGEGHIPGAIGVFLHGSAFPTRVGFVAPPESRLLLVVTDERDLVEATTQLAVVAFDSVLGFLDGGMEAWREAGLPLQTLDQITVNDLYALRPDLQVLDTRDRNEWNEGHIQGAVSIPYYEIEQRLPELKADQPLAVICGSGQRSTTASSLLQRHGFTQLLNVVGGMEAWDEAGFEKV